MQKVDVVLDKELVLCQQWNNLLLYFSNSAFNSGLLQAHNCRRLMLWNWWECKYFYRTASSAYLLLSCIQISEQAEFIYVRLLNCAIECLVTNSKYFWFLIIANVQLSPSLQTVESILPSAVSIQFPYIITAVRTARPSSAPPKSILNQQFSSMTMCTKSSLNLCYLLQREAGKWGLAAPLPEELLHDCSDLQPDAIMTGALAEMVLGTACLRAPSNTLKKLMNFHPLHLAVCYLDSILSLCLWSFS